MRPITASIESPAKAALALAVSTALAASLALAAPATAQAKTVKAPAKVKKPTVSKVKATSFKVTWKKAKRAKGYQVKVLKGSKTVKTITVKKKSCYATGLSSKTTYKVKVRAYNKSGKKIKYGKWSAVRSVTTTKSVAVAKADSYAWMHGGSSSSSKVHTHSWKSPSVQTTSMKVYYCLECGAKYTDKTQLQAHATEKEHWQVTGAGKSFCGYIFEDGVKTEHDKSAQLSSSGLAYSYVTFNGCSLSQANFNVARDTCSCGATKAHTHTWKKVTGTKKYVVLANRTVCNACGWVGVWSGPGVDRHVGDEEHSWSVHSGLNSTHTAQKNGYYYTALDHYVCTGCGLSVID